MRLNPDVERILIVNVSGEVVFDSDDMDDAMLRQQPHGPALVQEPERLEAVKRLEPTLLKIAAARTGSRAWRSSRPTSRTGAGTALRHLQRLLRAACSQGGLAAPADAPAA